MKNPILVLASLLILSLVTCNFINPWGNCEEGSGELVEQVIDLPPFSEFELAGSSQVIVKQADQQRVSIKAQQNIIDLLEREVKDEEWEISFKKCIKNHKEIIITIESPSIRSMEVKGSGGIRTEGSLKASEMELGIAGSGSITANLEVSKLECDIAGSGEMKLAGTSNENQIKINGSGDINAFELQSNSTSIKINGSGDVRVHADKKLEVKINGSGDVRYKGNATELKQSINGSGSLSKAS
jgi:hypothetical protein